jgi:hypothetical protein
MKYMNMNKYGSMKFPRGFLGANTLMITDGDDGDPGGDDGDPGGESLTAEEMAEFTKLKEAEEARNNSGKDRSIYEKMKADEATRIAKESGDQNMRGMVEFDLKFDALITDNKKYFNVTAEGVREVAKGLSGADLNNTLKVTALKSFFDNPENLEALSATEKAYVTEKVIGKHDRLVDTGEAWRIMTNGLHVLERINQQDQFKKGKQGDNSEMPNFDKYLEKAKARVKQKIVA